MITFFHLLRLGFGFALLWIGVLIIRNPQTWMQYTQPWPNQLFPFPVEQVTIGIIIVAVLVVVEVLNALIVFLHKVVDASNGIWVMTKRRSLAKIVKPAAIEQSIADSSIELPPAQY